MVQGLRVLYLSAEATPLVKVGGLGNVAGELPLALRALGLDVLLALPLHPAVNAAGGRIHRTIRTQIPATGGPLDASAHLGEMNGLQLLLLDGDPGRATAGVDLPADAH